MENPGSNDDAGKREDVNEEAPTEEEYDTTADPVIVDAFSSMKSAILSKRTDIVRQIICAAESIREDDYDSEDDAECSRKVIRDKYDSEEYIDMLSLLLIHKDTDSGTLLHIATRVDTADIVRTLLAAGSSCLVENHEKKNAYKYCSSDLVKSAYVGELLQAVSQGRVYRIEHLLKAGIDVNSCDSVTTCNSILHWAACYGELNVVSFVIQKGGHVNASNAQGTTPLHEAVHRGDYDIIEELLKNGADVNACAVSGPYKGKTPMDLCLDMPYFQDLLKEYEEKHCNGEVNGSLENGDINVEDAVYDYNGNISICSASSTSSNTTLKHLSLCPVPVKVDPMVKYLCPPPQNVKQFKGLFFVPAGEITVFIKNSSDSILAMHDVLELFVDKFQKIGIKLSFEYLAPEVNASSKTTHIQCTINKKCFPHDEEYKIQINTHMVFIVASCLASFFYGLSTFLQCLKLFKGKAVPLLQISDWPSCKQRSVILDFKENDIPKLDVLLQAVDLLAMFKVNQIQFNVEHFSPDSNVAFYTKCESFQLQVYCKKRFISVVPYVVIDYGSSLLRYSNDNGTPELCTETFIKAINTFLFFNLIHIDMVLVENQKIVHQLYNYCNKSGYVLQISSREIDIHVDEMPLLLNGVVCTINSNKLNGREWSEHVLAVHELGLQYITCYNCTQVNRIYPHVEDIVSSAYNIFSQPSLYNCYGVSIKCSFDVRRPYSFMSFLPSLFISSSMLWNLLECMKDEIYILNAINYLVYEDDKDHVGRMFIEIGRHLPVIPNGSQTEAESDECDNQSLFDVMLEGCFIGIDMLSDTRLQQICRTIKVTKQNLRVSKIESSLAAPLLCESSVLLNLMYLLSRIGHKLLDLKSKKKHASLRGLPEMSKSDESNRLMSVIQEYKTYCTDYCIQSNNSYVTLSLLDDLLQEIIPKCVQPSLCRLDGVIDI